MDQVDLNRYLGDWFEIARFPNWFQRTCTGDVRASYARRAGGRLDVINRCRTGDGHVITAQGMARIVNSGWGDYWVLRLADDYSWAVVGSPDRDYLWILAREPILDAAQFISAQGVARANGFAVERPIKTGDAAMPPVSRDDTP